MKTSVNGNFSLFNIQNYKKKIEEDNKIILDKYVKLVMEYLKYVLENIKVQNNNYTKFIIIRGIETIHHVFHLLLYYTNNIDITYFHSQKAVYFYVEFIQQTSTDENSFLQLNSRDATMYVYRKTIFEINNESRKMMNNNPNKEFNEKWEFFNKYTSILKYIISNLININNFQSEKNSMKYMSFYENIGNLFISMTLNEDDFKNIELFLNKLNLESIKEDDYLIIMELFFEKINEKIEILPFIKEKIYCSDDNLFNEKEKIILFLNSF